MLIFLHLLKLQLKTQICFFCHLQLLIQLAYLTFSSLKPFFLDVFDLDLVDKHLIWDSLMQLIGRTAATQNTLNLLRALSIVKMVGTGYWLVEFFDILRDWLHYSVRR